MTLHIHTVLVPFGPATAIELTDAKRPGTRERRIAAVLDALAGA